MPFLSTFMLAIISAFLILKTNSQCVQNSVNGYVFPGNPARVWGEPHFVLWNGAVHDYQGVTSTDPQGQQYYYITPCNGFTSAEMPIQLIGKHTQHGTTSYMTLSELTIVYQSNGAVYYIYLGNGYTKWALQSDGGKTYYEPAANYNTDLTQSQTNANIVGNLFVTVYPVGIDMYVDVLIPGSSYCEFKLQYNFQGGVTMMGVTIDVPTCYRCYICGLLGDFQNQGDQFETCDGNITPFTPGYIPASGHPSSYNQNGWSYQLPYYDANCNRRRMQEIVEWPIVIPDNYTFVDGCDLNGAIFNKSVSLCDAARFNNTDCCDAIANGFCDKLMAVCSFDSCILSESINDVNGFVDALLTVPVQGECAYIDANGPRYDPVNEIPVGDSLAPSESPSISPSMSPSIQPSISPTVPPSQQVGSSNACNTNILGLYVLLLLIVYIYL